MSRFRSVHAASRRVVALFGPIALASSLASAQEPSSAPRAAGVPTPIASTRSGETTSASLARSSAAVKAVPRFEGTPSPGLRVTLDGSGSAGGRVWYRWLQAQGTKVAIDDPTAAEAHFTVPVEASGLAFVLVVGNASGVDARAMTIEVEDPERDAVDQSLKADAGDDQSARVGRKVVLNGIRSEPRGKVRFRWLQAGGPRVELKTAEGPTASFEPAAPGTYRFALVVASTGGTMSAASTVEVTVGGTVRDSADPGSMAIDELARVSLASIDGGPRLADDLSKAFDGVADGIGSYRTFAEAIAETTKRLDAVVPRDKDRRAAWIERLFAPLMNRLVAGMKDDGLDLAQAGSQAQALTREQKARLAEQLRLAAAGLRASKTMR